MSGTTESTPISSVTIFISRELKWLYTYNIYTIRYYLGPFLEFRTKMLKRNVYCKTYVGVCTSVHHFVASSVCISRPIILNTDIFVLGCMQRSHGAVGIPVSTKCLAHGKWKLLATATVFCDTIERATYECLSSVCYCNMYGISLAKIFKTIDFKPALSNDQTKRRVKP